MIQIAQDIEGIVSLVVGLVISLVDGLVDLDSLVSETAGSSGERVRVDIPDQQRGR